MKSSGTLGLLSLVWTGGGRLGDGGRAVDCLTCERLEPSAMVPRDTHTSSTCWRGGLGGARGGGGWLTPGTSIRTGGLRRSGLALVAPLRYSSDDELLPNSRYPQRLDPSSEPY